MSNDTIRLDIFRTGNDFEPVRNPGSLTDQPGDRVTEQRPAGISVTKRLETIEINMRKRFFRIGSVPFPAI